MDPDRFAVLIKFSASNKSITLCSMSIVNQSNPAFENISAIAGWASVIQVPNVTSLFDSLDLSFFILSLIFSTRLHFEAR